MTQPSVALAAGSPVTFTMVFTAGAGSGGLTFNVGASGTTVATNVATSQQRTLDSVAINGSAVQQPTSQLTTTPAAPNGIVITTPLTLGWFLGTSATGVHIAGSATANEIDWSISDQNLDHLVPDAFQFSCGTSKDLSVSRDGGTQIFYRAVSTSGQTEAWHKVTIERSSGPSIDVAPAIGPNANNWYNGAVTVNWSATDVIAGLKQVTWSSSTGASGSALNLDALAANSSFIVTGQGSPVTATANATSNSGAVTSKATTLRIDTTPPAVSGTTVIRVMGTTTLAKTTGGWYRTPLDVVFSATDALSGFSGGTSATQTVSVTGEGNNLSAPVTFTDLAGNQTSSSLNNLKIDVTPPVIAVSTSVSPAATGWFNIATTKPTVRFTPSDPGAQPSGLATGSTAVQSVPVTADTLGTTLTSNVFSDVAGNTATAQYTYKMDTVAPTLGNVAPVGPGGIVANALGAFDLTGLQPTVGVALNVTAADSGTAASGLKGVCYDLSGGSACTLATAAGAGSFTLTLLSTVTNATIWSLDNAGNPSTVKTFTVKITRSAPVAAPLSFTMAANTVYQGTVTASGGSAPIAYTLVTGSGPMNGTVTINANGAFTYTPRANFGGSDSFKFSASDGLASSTATVSITVTGGVADQNPVCTAAVASPSSLWPPNHKFVAIAINGVTDPDRDPVTITVTQIWQDESTMADGSGDTPIDGAIVNGAAQVRAERAGDGNGRLYQIFFTATDGKGGSCTGSVTVGVPHDQSGGAVVDSGVRYDSTKVSFPSATIDPTAWNKFSVPAGTSPVVWTHAQFKPANVPTQTITTVSFTSVKFVLGGSVYPMPDGIVTFDPAAPAVSSTTFDSANGVWRTTINPNNISDENFFVGAAIPVDANIAGGGQSTITFNVQSSAPNVSFSWQWSAAAYTFWPTDWNQALIQSYHGNGPTGSQHADTPTNPAVQKTLIQGPRGGGGSNFTGSWSATGAGTATLGQP